MINVTSNGSKWYGEAPDSIETLLTVLSRVALDPRFEDYGNFIQLLYLPKTWDDPEEYKNHLGVVRFSGNFFNLSHVFNIDTDEPTLIKKLTKAIRDNQASEGYKEARKNWKECPHCHKLTRCFTHSEGEHMGEHINLKCKDKHKGRYTTMAENEKTVDHQAVCALINERVI